MVHLNGYLELTVPERMCACTVTINKLVLSTVGLITFCGQLTSMHGPTLKGRWQNPSNDLLYSIITQKLTTPLPLPAEAVDHNTPPYKYHRSTRTHGGI
jgi:hypothetical protein